MGPEYRKTENGKPGKTEAWINVNFVKFRTYGVVHKKLHKSQCGKFLKTVF